MGNVTKEQVRMHIEHHRKTSGNDADNFMLDELKGLWSTLSHNREFSYSQPNDQHTFFRPFRFLQKC